MAGYPRVTHPSATKLTKSLPKLWQRLTPFDLHVLSTPPAFILSQDQTLIFSSLFVLQVLTGFRFFELCLSTLFWIFSQNTVFSSCIPLEFSGLHYCLFVKVLTGFLPVLLSSFSQTQLWYNIMCSFVCQQLFYIFLSFFMKEDLKGIKKPRLHFLCKQGNFIQIWLTPILYLQNRTLILS